MSCYTEAQIGSDLEAFNFLENQHRLYFAHSIGSLSPLFHQNGLANSDIAMATSQNRIPNNLLLCYVCADLYTYYITATKC
jgi:hypothetical protein